MNVFDPMQSMNALAGGAQIGGAIRQTQTQNALAPMVAKGDYKGAMDYAGSRGDLGQVDAMRTQYEAQIAKMTAEEKAAGLARVEGIARVAMGGMDIPEDQLGNYVASNQAALAEYGVPPEQIAQWSQPGALNRQALQKFVTDATPFAEMLKTQVVSQGSQVYQGGRMIAENPKDAPQPKYETVTLNDGEYEYIPGQPETMRKLGNSPVKTPLSTTTINMPGEKREDEFAKALGKNAADNLNSIFVEGKDANNKIAKAQTMEALLDEIDYTGWGGNTLLASQRILQALGVTVADDIGAKEAASALTKEMGLALKSDLPGPMSNADREFLMSIPPGINVTDAGNDALLYMYKARNKYSAELSDYMYSVNPRTEQQYNDAIRSFNMEYGPIFSEEDQIQLMKAVSGISE